MGQEFGPWQGQPGFEQHGAWWGFFHLLPFLMFLILIGVGIWAIVRFTSPAGARMASAGMAPPAPRDAALEELRIRYARGDLERSDFAQRMRDLGGTDLGLGPDPTSSGDASAASPGDTPGNG